MFSNSNLRRPRLLILLSVCALVCAIATLVAFEHKPAQRASAAVPHPSDAPKMVEAGLTESPVSLQGLEATTYLRQQGTYESLTEAVTAAPYTIHEVDGALSRNESAYEALNPAKALRASFTSNGVRINSSGGRRKWQVRLKPSADASWQSEYSTDIIFKTAFRVDGR